MRIVICVIIVLNVVNAIAQISYPTTDLEEHNDGGIYIRTNIDSFDSKNFIESIYGEVERLEFNKVYDNSVKALRYVRISYFEDGVFVCDHSTGIEVVKEEYSKLRNKITNYFSEKPEYMFAIIAYESGAVYGYRLVEQGKIDAAAYTDDSGYSSCREGRILEQEVSVLNQNNFRFPDFNTVAVVSELISLANHGKLILNETNKNEHFYLKNSD